MYDVVHFIEGALGVELLDYQKDFVKKTYKEMKDNKQLHPVLACGEQKFSLTMLRALVVYCLMNEVL